MRPELFLPRRVQVAELTDERPTRGEQALIVLLSLRQRPLFRFDGRLGDLLELLEDLLQLNCSIDGGGRWTPCSRSNAAQSVLLLSWYEK